MWFRWLKKGGVLTVFLSVLSSLSFLVSIITVSSVLVHKFFYVT